MAYRKKATIKAAEKTINTMRTGTKVNSNTAKRKAYSNKNVKDLMASKTAGTKTKITKPIKRATSGIKKTMKSTMKKPSMKNAMDKASNLTGINMPTSLTQLDNTSYTPQMKSIANKVMKNFKKKGVNI